MPEMRLIVDFFYLRDRKQWNYWNAVKCLHNSETCTKLLSKELQFLSNISLGYIH
jgi:hypothetical protein